jgi:hypothetical protein
VDLVIGSATDWAIMMKPLNDLKTYFVLQRYSPEFEDEVLTFFYLLLLHLVFCEKVMREFKGGFGVAY